MRRRGTVGTWPLAPPHTGDAHRAPPDRVPCHRTTCGRGRDTSGAFPAPACHALRAPDAWDGRRRRTRGGQTASGTPRGPAPALVGRAGTRRGDGGTDTPGPPPQAFQPRTMPERTCGTSARCSSPGTTRSTRPWSRARGTGASLHRTARTGYGAGVCGAAEHPTPALLATALGGDTGPPIRFWEDGLRASHLRWRNPGASSARLPPHARRKEPNARGEPRQQPQRGTSGGCWRRLQCVVRRGSWHRRRSHSPTPPQRMRMAYV